MKYWWLAVFCLLNAMPSLATSAELEKRMLGIAAELRCLVCQNESIAASRADLAVDLRQQIREQIQAGQTDDEIRTYMVERYGDFVLYRPPFKATTFLLWFGPMLLFFFGLTILMVSLRRRKARIVNSSLSDEDRRRANALLAQAADTGKR
ncbi:cytochrome c-type biogenesis protein [Orrella marina]|uniref:Cytochrome c-type biogenesis protein n=1 Tax=Orrella marina TaxID=2163011 RepID=A0A2R4XJN1_9BURK|nr:cytochrome c-type biogenesis protein CcmH [Orrella marina]